jgi:hypothetical protein
MTAHANLGTRIIDWASLDTRLRRVIVVAAALFLGLGAATFLRSSFPGEPDLVTGYRIQPLVTIIAGIATVIGFALLIAGISFAGSAVRYAGIVGLALVSFVLVFVGGSGLPGAAEIAALFFVAASALVIFGNRLSWPRLLALAFALTASVAVAVIWVSIATHTNYSSVIVFWMLGAVAFVITPVLVVTGWDLSEIAADIASAVRRVNLAALTPGVRTTLIAVASVAIAWWLNSQHGHATSGELFFRVAALGLLAVCLAAALAQVAPAGRLHRPHIAYAAMLAPAAVIFAADWSDALFTKDEHGTYNTHGLHEFSLVLPKRWARTSDPSDLDDRGSSRLPLRQTFGPEGAPFPRLTIMAYPRNVKSITLPSGIALPKGATGTFFVPFNFTHAPDPTSPWHWGLTKISDYPGGELQVLASMLVVETGLSSANVTWYRICAAHASDDAGSEECLAAYESFRRDVRTEPDHEVAAMFNVVLWTVLGIAALTTVAVSGSPTGAFAFMAWIALVIVIRNIGAADVDFHHGSVAVTLELSADIIASGLLVGCVALFVANVEAGRRDSPGLVAARDNALAFQRSLVVLALIFILYVYGAKGSTYSNEIRGAIVILVLTWEFVTSGAAMTNGDTARFPRSARILFYLGYLTLVATVVFYFVRLDRVLGERQQEAFDTEIYVAAGIACLGLPYLLYRHVSAWLSVHATAVVEARPLPVRG